MKSNRGLSIDEKKHFADLVADALLSQAWIHVFYNTNDGRRIDLGSTRFFALNLLDVHGTSVYITDPVYNKRYKVPMSDIWRVFYYKCKELSQPALEEAIHISREMTKKERGAAKVFSSDEVF